MTARGLTNTSTARQASRCVLAIAVSNILAISAMAEATEAAGPAETAPQTSAAAAPAASDDQALQEITVSSTRLNIDGMRAPTPVTVVTLQDMQSTVPRDLTEVINEIPSIAGSMTPVGRSVQASNGTNGISAPALRGLGSNRTLVLIDGHRSAAVTQTGETDVGNIPEQLVERIDVVTGGASAAYGSDALAGVVNFILDKKFTGTKVEVQGGESTYGDDQNYKVEISHGFKFAGDRGHVILSGLISENNGVFGNETGDAPPRPWEYGAPGVIANPAYTTTNGLPQYIVVPNFASASATKGGLIVNGPLRGTAFDKNGNPYAFNFGTLEKTAPGGVPLYMSGGDWQASDVTGLEILDPRQRRDGLFGRFSFDVTDKLNVYVQLSRNHDNTRGGHSTFAQQGDLLVHADNAFLPASVAAAAAADGVSTFNMGIFKTGERQGGLTDRVVTRYLVGATDSFDLFNRSWDLDAYAQRSESHNRETVTGIRITQNYLNAIDSVINPATGAAICRSTLTNPNNGCVPYNIFGFQPLDPAVATYAYGDPTRWEHFDQDVFAVTMRGEPFSTWAGPIPIAFGIEHRREEADGTVDSLSGPPTAYATQILPLNGAYTVTEGFAEISVPLLLDQSFTKSLDLNAAVRETDYSVTGAVTTWKVGFVWAPINDVRFRVTRSRDIRAPNLSELFTKGLQNTVPITDPFRDNLQSSLAVQVTQGNLDLKPEKADNWGMGIVFQPSFLPGFNASVDYYRLKVEGIIGTLTPQQIVQQCFAGLSTFCGAIDRDTSGPIVNGLYQITRVRNTFFNYTSQLARGIDLETSYRIAGWNFRLFGTRFLEDTVNNGITPPVNIVGDMRSVTTTPATGAIPKWKLQASVGYTWGEWTPTVTARAISDGRYGGPQSTNQQYVVCSANCPASTALNPTINQDHVAGVVYFDAALNYRPLLPGDPEFFAGVHNIANRAPPLVPRGYDGLAYGNRPTNEWVYDLIGRTYTAGVRFKF